MFWKRKPSQQEIEDQLKAETAQLVEIIKGKWVQFQTLMPFRADVPLAVRIEAFIVPVREDIVENYPFMRAAPHGLIWEMVFVVVIESKTHPPDEVSRARAALAAKYVQG